MTPAPKGALLRHLKALAQRLDPCVRLGKAGPTEAFHRALDIALTQHELVKVKFDDFKDQKKTLSPQIAERAQSHIVMRVGNVLVLYRQNPDPQQRRIRFKPPTGSTQEA
jgi:RNA-binding protein